MGGLQDKTYLVLNRMNEVVWYNADLTWKKGEIDIYACIKDEHEPQNFAQI